MDDFYARRTCLNGHVISNYVGAPFDTPQDYCGKCGEKTIVNCPYCNAPQRGKIKNTIARSGNIPLSYCPNCGKPYPWTERRLAATAEMVKEETQLSNEDKDLLTATLSDLASDTPGTPLAATRFKRIVEKAGGVFKQAMYKFLVDCASETAKKIVMGS